MSENDISLDSLPYEIVEYILKFNSLSYVDICSISNVSRSLNCISKSNELWRMKYYQMWPHMIKLFDLLSTDWKNEFQQRLRFKKKIIKRLHELSIELYHFTKISPDAFHDMKTLCENHPLTDQILLEELKDVLYNSNPNQNLTIKYYAEKALIYIRHCLLSTIWETFLNSEPRPSLLKGASLIQQWCQPSDLICTKGLSDKINGILKLVFIEIIKVCPNHPVIKRGYSNIVNEFGEVLDKSLWESHHCKKILNCINYVLFGKLKWKCIEALNTLDEIYINLALDKKMGIPVIVGIVYEAIARQLGVHLLPINFPGRFLLKWLEDRERPQEFAWTYIDLFANGSFKKEHELKELASGYDALSDSWIEPVSSVKVFARMCWNVVEMGRQHDQSGKGGITYMCYGLELLSILCPEDMEHKLLLARVYMHLSINITRVIHLLQEIAASDPVSTGFVAHMYEMAIATLQNQTIKQKIIKVKRRTSEEYSKVKLAIGMIVRDRRCNYLGVIYGWDPCCNASKEWLARAGVARLRYGENQPFYNVLVSDGTTHYAAQENLDVPNSYYIEEPIKHKEIGRYFEKFNGRFYFPNEFKRQEYPNDAEVRDRFLSDFLHMLAK